jgi:diguanylate cyclase (GGDEF)-like protein
VNTTQHGEARRGWFDLRRRDIRDALTVLSLSWTVFAGTIAFALYKYFSESPGDEHFQLITMTTVLLACCVAAVTLGTRRFKDLRTNILARRMAEEKAADLATHDPLTGLPNRRLFIEQVNLALQRMSADADRVAVLMIDLDGFRAVNDRYGHACGNEVLVKFARRAAALLDPTSHLARFGDDDFSVLLPSLHWLDEPMQLARRLVAEASVPFVIGGQHTTLSASVGIALAPDNGNDRDELIRRAQLALRLAKADRRGSIRCFKPEMDAQVVQRTRIERELRAGATDAITVHYQPVVDLGTSTIIGFEALARWTDAELGPIPPDIFISIAEECGLINALGDRLLRIACREATTWPADVTLAFNVSPIQLCEPTLGLRILTILGETGLNPRRLEIEVTESALMENMEVARRVIDQLRQAGVRVALDDFGTGYATFSQLLALRLDKIKIDRSFVSRLGRDDESMVIIRAIIGLAGGFGLATTAEGIEDAEQLARLRENGCVQGQGWLFGKAIPASQIPHLLGSTQAAAANG